MKCSDCLGYEYCKFATSDEYCLNDVDTTCRMFKDKSQYKQITYCENCKHFKRNTTFCINRDKGYCEIDLKTKDKKHFCGYAERKE